MNYSTKKYLLYPEHIRSRTDGDLHYISASQLAALYKVRINECVIVYEWEDIDHLECGDLIKLFVRWYGDYTLPENKA